MQINKIMCLKIIYNMWVILELPRVILLISTEHWLPDVITLLR